MTITLNSAMGKYMEHFRKSGEMTEKCKEFLPGGFSRKTFNFGPHAIFVDHGDGAYIYTIDGHKLLDMNNNFTVSILGHNHPAINKALMEAIPKGFSFGNPMELESKLAKMLIDRIPGVEKVKFSCSASESALSAVRIARGYTGKYKVAKMEGGYHGFTDPLAISAHPDPSRFPGPDHNPQPLADSAGIAPWTIENTIMLKQNDLAVCEKILRENAKDVACVIMELQSGAGGIVSLTQEFVEGMRALTEELGIVLIFDETISLRASYHGLQGLYGVNPDLTIMGKMIGGGMPIGAVGGSAKVFEVVEADQVAISGTHHGHALACAAGIACLEVMDEAAFARLNGMAVRLKKELNDWAAKENLPFIIYGNDYSFLAYAFMNEMGTTVTTHRDFWGFADGEKIFTYGLEMATRGFYPVHRGMFSLTLPMTDADIDSYIETTKEVAKEMYK